MWFRRPIGDLMSDIIVNFKIMPESVETDLDDLENKIKESISPQKIERVPIAFGLNSVNIIKLVDEKDNAIEEVTETLQKIEGIREVEVTGITKSL